MTLMTLTRRDEARLWSSLCPDRQPSQLLTCHTVTDLLYSFHISIWKSQLKTFVKDRDAHKRSVAKLFSGLVGSLFFLLWFIKRFLKGQEKCWSWRIKSPDVKVLPQWCHNSLVMYICSTCIDQSRWIALDLAGFHWTVNFTINSWQWRQVKTRSLLRSAIKSCSDFLSGNSAFSDTYKRIMRRSLAHSPARRQPPVMFLGFWTWMLIKMLVSSGRRARAVMW